MKNKLAKQILIIVGLVAFFVTTNVFIYFVFTSRCVNYASSQMQAKSVEVDQFLPFAEETKIVKKDNPEKLSGELPKIDGAAALFPVFSSFVYSLYPETSVKYENGDFTSDSALQYHNTRGAYKGIVDGTIDIAICAKPSNEQVQYGLDKGVELELTPIGREAFVFLVIEFREILRAGHLEREGGISSRVPGGISDHAIAAFPVDRGQHFVRGLRIR